jgi:hypothetical protein
MQFENVLELGDLEDDQYARPLSVGDTGEISMCSFAHGNVEDIPVHTVDTNVAVDGEPGSYMLSGFPINDTMLSKPTPLEPVEHDRFVCNDLEQYLDRIKKMDGNVAMKTRYGTELRFSYSATVNMFTTPDAKLGGVIRASDPALTQQGINDKLVALVPTRTDGVVKAAEQYCGCGRIKKSSAGPFHYLREHLAFCEHNKFRKSCFSCAPENFCSAGRKHGNGNLKRKSQCDKLCCAQAKFSTNRTLAKLTKK